MEKQQIQLLGEEVDSGATRTSSKRRTDHKGMLLTVVTANETTTPTFTPKVQIQGKDGTWVDAWVAAAAIDAAGTFHYLLYPGTAIGPYTEYVDTVLPFAWRLVLTFGGTGSINTEAFADLIP